MQKKGVLLINLGTPNSSSVSDVRKYLREFLMDERVIDIPFVSRWLLVNGIITTFRGPKSAEEYKKVWTKDGSPLLTNGVELTKKLQEKLGNNYVVSLGMRYQNPSIKKALEVFKNCNITDIKVIPLYPQYASATTGSTIQKVYEDIKDWQNIPSLSVVNQFYNNPLFIKALASIASQYISKKEYDHFVFSYHGLPERQIEKASCNNHCKLNNECCSVITENNTFCYRAQCYETTRLLTKSLNIKEENYTICFQSRLGKSEWIKPYAEDTIKHLAENGTKKVLAFSPAFVSDCLETTIEVGQEYKHEFIEQGGEDWDLVESLNINNLWVETLEDLVKN